MKTFTSRLLACAAVLALLGSGLAPSDADAGGRLDIRSWLDRPGVKVVAVEFYATWCKPCMASVPRWKALHEKYRDDGFRLIVINTLDPGGGCSQVPWNPDHRICDDDGFVGNSFGVGGNLPAAFLWSWQGDLLVKKGHIDTIEQEVKRYLHKNPRVVVQATTADGKPDELMETMVRSEIQMSGKFDVVVSKEERAKLAAIRKDSHAMAARPDHQCKVGAAISANSILRAKVLGNGNNQKLSLSLNSAETGCLLATNWAGFNQKRASQSVREAVVGLIDKLRSPPEHPKGGRFGGRPAAAAAAVVKESSIGGDEGEWDPTGAAATQAVVKLRSNPVGAVVFVDGRLFCKATPCSKAIDLGRHNIDMQLDEYMPKREVVDIKGSQTLVWELLADFAMVKVETTPPNIPVSVDGRERKPGELANLKLSDGPHEFVVEGRCFYKAGERVVVKRGETRTVTIAPKARPSAIKVSAVDEKGNDLAAKVLVDGKLLEGETPRVFPIPVCSQRIRVEADGKVAYESALSLEEKQVQPINATLKPVTAKLLGSLSGGGGVGGGIGLKGSANSSAKNAAYATECAKGVARSCNWLGLAYHNGNGVPKDRTMALKLFNKGCTLGYAISCGNAGNAHKDGWGTPKDAREAVRMYTVGCDKKHDHSCNELGLMYHFGRGGLTQNRSQALRLFEKACNFGNGVSCGNAGNAYKNGWGTAKNQFSAGSRYKKGCSLGHAHSCNEFGIMYHFGRGYSQNRVEALTLFTKACNLGNKVSCSNVGNAYKNGWGTRRDTYQAKRWYKKACDQGHSSACTEMRKL